MAKRNKEASEEEPRNGSTQVTDTNTDDFGGYEEQSDDVVGYWESDAGLIHCIPRGARLFDGNIDRTKPSILLYATLVDPCAVSKKSEEDEDAKDIFTAPAGSLVGIWGKPGMRAIRNLAGVKVKMLQKGTKDTGKGNPMKLYKIGSEPGGAQRGKPIPITEDTRVKSRHVSTFLERGHGSDEEETPEQANA